MCTCYQESAEFTIFREWQFFAEKFEILERYEVRQHIFVINSAFFSSNELLLQCSMLSCCHYREASLAIRNIDVVTSSRSKSNPIAKYASENQLTCYHEMTADHIRRQNYDIGIVVSYGYLIPKDVIDAFPRYVNPLQLSLTQWSKCSLRACFSGMINVHASLLPRWRGAAPIIYAIMNGDRTTGATIMTIKPNRFDTGEVSTLSRKTSNIPDCYWLAGFLLYCLPSDTCSTNNRHRAECIDA